LPGAEEADRHLADVGQSIVQELDPEIVLDRILAEARRLTGARYAALGVLDSDRTRLERFLTAGIDSATHQRIGQRPRGRGVLGVLIEEPRPLRLRDVGEHPQSYGFPAGHPDMRTFLGVPILIRGAAWGNLYLAEKEDGKEFDQEDEDAAIMLSRWAAIAIENARVHEESEQRRRQLEDAVRALEASLDIAAAIGSVADLDRLLELIAKRGRALIDAQYLVITVRDGDDLVVLASAGKRSDAYGRRLSIAGSTIGQVLRLGVCKRISNAGRELQIPSAQLGITEAHSALLVPMLHRGTTIGVLAAFDHGTAGSAFSDEDERMLKAFAQSAANAVAIKNSVEADRLRTAIAAADAERMRWARELHDQTLQALGGLRVLLASTVGRGDAEKKDLAIRQAMDDIDLEIANLRQIITDLRPSLLDDLGLLSAIEALLDRHADDGLQIDRDLTLIGADHLSIDLPPELETTVYRLVQEALTNVIKHSRASHVRVSLGLDEGGVIVEVKDDGEGFDVSQPSEAFGLAGMRERVSLAGGRLSVDSGEHGTVVEAQLPLRGGDAMWISRDASAAGY
jgi:two-component system, NarL family, sensor histidine kinase DevS